MSRTTKSLTAAAISALIVSTSHATLPPPPDWGLTGLRNVEIHAMEWDDETIKRDPLDDSTPCWDLKNDVVRAGLNVVRSCAADQMACGALHIWIETRAVPGDDRVIYRVTLKLTQDVRLVREPKRKLSLPSTYQRDRFGLVSKSAVATKTCEDLKELLSDFLQLWEGWNHKY